MIHLKFLGLFFLFLLSSLILHGQTTKVDTTFRAMQAFNDRVLCSLIQPDGKIIVGGSFNYYKGKRYVRVARLNPDGSPDANFISSPYGQDGSVVSIALQKDGKIIIAGLSLENNLYPYVVRLNADGSWDKSFAVTINNRIHSILVTWDQKIIIAGRFTTVNGIACNRIARLNTDGTLDASFNVGSGVDSTVYALKQLPDKSLLIGGRFNSINSYAVSSLAKLKENGSIDSSFQRCPLSYTVRSIGVQSNNKIIIGGDFFYNLSGKLIEGLARLNEDGSFDSSFPEYNVNFANQVEVLSDDKIVVSGEIIISNVLAKSLVKLNPDGSMDSEFNAINNTTFRFDGYIMDIPTPFAVFSDGSILGCYGTSIKILSKDGMLNRDWNPCGGPDVSVTKIVKQEDGKFIIGGSFTYYNGVRKNSLARLNRDGTLDHSYAAGIRQPVTCLITQPGEKLIAGSNEVGLYRFLPNGEPDETFARYYDWKVQDAQPLPSGNIIVTGKLNISNWTYGIVKIFPDGRIDNSFNYYGTPVSDLPLMAGVQNNKILIGVLSTTIREMR